MRPVARDTEDREQGWEQSTRIGVSPQVLALRAKRVELLSANIANADTPGYKARDIDFAAAMREASGQQGAMLRTHEQHLGGSGAGAATGDVMYRIPSQPSLDGNTVETQVEHAEFMDNAVRYQASINFMDGRIAALRLAIRGQVMSLFNAINVAATSLEAQSVRLNTISSNLANANAVSSSEQGTYRAQYPVFESVYQEAAAGVWRTARSPGCAWRGL
jgi:flagellar basal-body rod protein FlgB